MRDGQYDLAQRVENQIPPMTIHEGGPAQFRNSRARIRKRQCLEPCARSPAQRACNRMNGLALLFAKAEGWTKARARRPGGTHG